ncbi:unnamed protein product [Orchesella dallaii]|uniref:sulfite oxidase n=1 Tax=Orchesella dallaii TaxID=48710 RepID=A0ABP1SBA2_9HEXA
MRTTFLSSSRICAPFVPSWYPSVTGIESNPRHDRQHCAKGSRKFHQYREYQSQSGNDTKGHMEWSKLGGTIGAVAITGYLVWKKSSSVAQLDAQKHHDVGNRKHEQALKHLPYFSRNEVAEHYDDSRRVWVSFRRGVYDVTEFSAVHPGGSRILMAAGGSLEPFWELYPVHQKSDVFHILEKYRIGNLNEDDVLETQESVDHFKGEPMRHPALIRRAEKPFNGETPPSLLIEKFHTPNDVFYVRNHLPVPQVDAKTYSLEIDGISLNEVSLSLQDIKKFPKVSISATIQCGGNRRTEMGKGKPVAGLGWTGGAIGNAKWTGARLVDVLRTAGFKPEAYKHPEKFHVKFDGLDTDQSGECYGASVPLSYLLDGNFDAILAYEMNDKPIPIDHGFPIRIVLPGIVGARSVKWLSRVSISDEESQSPWQQRDYKVFSPSVSLETVDFSAAPPIMETPVTSYICSHDDGDKVKKGPLKLQGYLIHKFQCFVAIEVLRKGLSHRIQ